MPHRPPVRRPSSPAQPPKPNPPSDQASAFACSALQSELRAELRQVCIADRHAFHRVSPRLILFHHQPFGPRVTAGAHDFRPVEVAFPDRAIARIASMDRHVLEMHERGSVRESAYPRGWVGAAELQPICVQLGLERIRRSGRKHDLQPRLLTESLQLVAVIVIGELQPRRPQLTRELGGLRAELAEALARAILFGQGRYNHILAASLAALGSNAVELLHQAIERRMSRARNQSCSLQLLAEATYRVRTQACNLDRPVADFSQAAEYASEARRVLEHGPNGVELDGDHVATTSWSSSGSRDGGRQLLRTSTRRPVVYDSWIDSMTSSTWYTRSAAARGLSPLTMASAISATTWRR